jgi:hypothetical protein
LTSVARASGPPPPQSPWPSTPSAPRSIGLFWRQRLGYERRTPQKRRMRTVLGSLSPLGFPRAGSEYRTPKLGVVRRDRGQAGGRLRVRVARRCGRVVAGYAGPGEKRGEGRKNAPAERGRGGGKLYRMCGYVLSRLWAGAVEVAGEPRSSANWVQVSTVSARTAAGAWPGSIRALPRARGRTRRGRRRRRRGGGCGRGRRGRGWCENAGA